MKPAVTSQTSSSPSGRMASVEPLRDRLLRPGRHWVLVSVAMYVLASLLPAMPPFMGETITGWICLTMFAYDYAPWWANPSYFVAVIASLLNRPRIAVGFAAIAALLALSYEFRFIQNNGVARTMKDLYPGCLMWIASLQLLACHELWRQWLEWQRRRDRRERKPDESV